MRETVLDVAARLTSSERQAVYGHPRLHFACTAAMVEAFLLRRGWTAPEDGLLPEDWACIISLDKLARQAGNITATGKLHADTLADQAGYARTGEMLDEQPAEPEQSWPSSPMDGSEADGARVYYSWRCAPGWILEHLRRGDPVVAEAVRQASEPQPDGEA